MLSLDAGGCLWRVWSQRDMRQVHFSNGDAVQELQVPAVQG